jgi:hypothetical protein
LNWSPQYSWWSSISCSSLQPHVLSSLLGPAL